MSANCCLPLTTHTPLPSWRKLIAKLQAPPKKQKPGDPPPVKVKHALPALASELLAAEQITRAHASQTPAQVKHGDVFVAKRYGGWQEVVLRALGRCFDKKNGVFQSDALNAVNEEFKAAAASGVGPVLQVGALAAAVQGC